MPFVPPTAPKCAICNKSVYPQECQEAGGLKFHKTCFKCSVCQMVLNIKNFMQKNDGGTLYCKRHYNECTLGDKFYGIHQ